MANKIVSIEVAKANAMTAGLEFTNRNGLRLVTLGTKIHDAAAAKVISTGYIAAKGDWHHLTVARANQGCKGFAKVVEMTPEVELSEEEKALMAEAEATEKAILLAEQVAARELRMADLKARIAEAQARLAALQK